VANDPAVATERIEQAVDDLDLTVRHIRTAIFGLETTRSRSDSLRNRVLGLVREAADSLGFEPRVLLDGPIDAGVSDAIADEMVATLREAVTNVVKHAHASALYIEVLVADDLLLRITDDGVGPPAETTPRGHGLRNMALRAEKLDGTFSLVAAEPTGSVAEWRVPLD
jgi:signal transduction histidine kinase